MATNPAGLVSTKQVRYQEGGFDLNLTYITPRVIAMSSPSPHNDSSEDNPIFEVHRFLNTKYKSHFRLYDLRAERGANYEVEIFGGEKQCAGYRFYDNNPPPLELLKACCSDMKYWIDSHPDNVVVVHCNNGRGRTGVVIASFLLLSQQKANAREAIQYFGEQRTFDGRGIVFPSQIRYVLYYEASLYGSFFPHVYRIRHIRVHTIPSFDVNGGCDPYFYIRLGDGRQEIFNWLNACKRKIKKFKKGKGRYMDFDLTQFEKGGVRVRGDVKVVFFDWDQNSEPEKMFRFWFNTGFIDNNYLLLHKEVVDLAHKDKDCAEFDEDFKVELFLDREDDSSIFEESIRTKARMLEADDDEDEDESKDADIFLMRRPQAAVKLPRNITNQAK